MLTPLPIRTDSKSFYHQPFVILTQYLNITQHKCATVNGQLSFQTKSDAQNRGPMSK